MVHEDALKHPPTGSNTILQRIPQQETVLGRLLCSSASLLEVLDDSGFNWTVSQLHAVYYETVTATKNSVNTNLNQQMYFYCTFTKQRVQKVSPQTFSCFRRSI
ncbi:hypothetical protein ILYODFUR_017884 [Ilyodon furcidens]|uniref:Uncharacterized protein n=1 Tax=Ilyodon furcidens TaxID=33524 RepID=A0ABV0TCD6_9TELE